MTPLMTEATDWLRHSQLAAAFLDVCLKSTVILSLAGAVCAFWRNAAASARHLVWCLAVLAVLFLPLVPRLMPAWEKPIWTVSTRNEPGDEISITLQLVPTAETPRPLTSAEPLSAGTSNHSPANSAHSVSTHISRQWVRVTFLVWLAGTSAYLLWIALGYLRVRALQRTAFSAGEYQQAVFQHITGELRLRRRVKFLLSREDIMPMTWGWIRPAILLPAESMDWTKERLRLVLLHEFGHVLRWDCLTQIITQLGCALYWFNPLMWVAARQMGVERERACDDLVLSRGCRPSDYAEHLVEIAQSFRRVPRPAAAIPMARSSQLDGRVEAIVDACRPRRFSHSLLVGCSAAAVLVLVSAFAAPQVMEKVSDAKGKPWFEERLSAFFKQKELQARALAGDEETLPDVWRYFQAGANGDWVTVTNLSATLDDGFRNRSYGHSLDKVWSPVLETDLAWDAFSTWKEKYVLAFGEDIIKSILPGSIYFGGTDAGRGVITAMCESHVEGKPFFTITQNGLADGNYLEYLREMYGKTLYIPNQEDSQKCFQEYVTGADQRLKTGKLKPDEHVRQEGNRVQISGRVAVMQINGLLAKIIFERNPNHEFYLEESFPLDWMYPHLSPHGLILKVNREPLAQLSAEMVRRDHEYWSSYVKPMLGAWIKQDTSLAEIAAFVEKVYLKHDLRGFSGDPRFVQDKEAQKNFSKLRNSIAGVYVWRSKNAKSPEEKKLMINEADFAFRQAFALCPANPEVLSHYGGLLLEQHRTEDARVLAETALIFDPENEHASDLKKRAAYWKNPPKTDLHTRIFLIERPENLRKVKGLDPGKSMQDLVIDYFKQHNLRLEEPCYAKYDPSTSALEVHATMEELDKIGALIGELDQLKPQAESQRGDGATGFQPAPR
jgi:beta-lactamase regulating signal transducer with metallopeptidase domain